MINFRSALSEQSDLNLRGAVTYPLTRDHIYQQCLARLRVPRGSSSSCQPTLERLALLPSLSIVQVMLTSLSDDIADQLDLTRSIFAIR